MALTKLQDALTGVNRLGIDTDATIYFVQANPTYDALVAEVFSRIGNGQITGFASTISLLETLVLPIRTGDVLLQEKFRGLLLDSSNLYLTPVSPALAERAAEIRALYNLKTPDAIQAATALETACDAFLTNNGKDFRRVKSLNVLVLDELEL